MLWPANRAHSYTKPPLTALKYNRLKSSKVGGGNIQASREGIPAGVGGSGLTLHILLKMSADGFAALFPDKC
jgi:hypothetical protein